MFIGFFVVVMAVFTNFIKWTESPIVTADNTLTLLKKETGIG